MLLAIDEIQNALKKSLPGVPESQLQKAAQAISEATGQWQEVDLKEELGANISVQCQDICTLGEAFAHGKKIRAFIEK
jgi:hypothetical protein